MPEYISKGGKWIDKNSKEAKEVIRTKSEIESSKPKRRRKPKK